MKAIVTRPLRQYRDIECLFDHVTNTEFKLQHGLIRTVRELEVTLISCSKVLASCIKNYQHPH